MSHSVLYKVDVFRGNKYIGYKFVRCEQVFSLQDDEYMVTKEMLDSAIQKAFPELYNTGNYTFEATR